MTYNPPLAAELRAILEDACYCGDCRAPIHMERGQYDAIDRAAAELERGWWVSVEERLPQVQTYVVVQIKDGPVRIGSRLYGNIWESQTSSRKLDVTHWMPLPPAPSQPERAT